MTSISKQFRGHYQIWIKKNQDLLYYFNNIFEPSLKMLRERAKISFDFNVMNIDRPKHNCMFVPIGYSLESVSLMACLFEPEYLTFGYSESAGRFFRKSEMELKKNILKHCPNTHIETLAFSDSDNKNVELTVQKWIEIITRRYSLSLSQIAIDITGGTKPMAIGLQNIAQTLGIDAYYLRVDYDEDTLWPLLGTEQLIRISGPFVDDNFIFVIMPFSAEFRSIYDFGIKGAADIAGYKCMRVADEIYLGGIMDKIRENIRKARFIIADISVYNPNVYYELGLAEGMNKDIIMLTNNVDTLPFDLRHKRVLPYSVNNVAQLRSDLERNLGELRRSKEGTR